MALNGKNVPELAPPQSITTAMRIFYLVHKEITKQLSDFISQSSHSGWSKNHFHMYDKDVQILCMVWEIQHEVPLIDSIFRNQAGSTLFENQTSFRHYRGFLLPFCFLKDLNVLKKQSHTLERLVAEIVDVKSGATYCAFCGMQRQGSW